MYAHFSQNNSGGSFDYDKEKGISVAVVIECDSILDAIRRAKKIGIYFNGVDKNIDCGCCGDRWSKPYKLDEKPMRYTTLLDEAFAPLVEEEDKYPIKWMDNDRYEYFLHKIDGSIIGFYRNKNDLLELKKEKE